MGRAPCPKGAKNWAKEPASALGLNLFLCSVLWYYDYLMFWSLLLPAGSLHL